ncbi:Tn3 family transposase [Streptomyces sp. NPDC126497]|uniref:Tn3 family transposase n=1 Tax=Streptomyces sp. NPDC126497 TaxID=3155313 RepID=UPI00331FFF1E
MCIRPARKPHDGKVFTAQLQCEMREAFGALDTKLPKLPWVTISGKHRGGAVKFTEPEPQKEPKNLRRLKKAIRKKWGTVALIDILKEALQRGIQEGLNVVGGWNGANDIIFFGKSGELSSNRRDQQELSVLALHLLQTALVFVHTLMIQDTLADHEWADVLTDEDKRAPTPLFWMHVQPYGEVRLNMGSRLHLTAPAPTDPEPATA